MMRVTYELHSQVKDRWNIECVYRGDQKEEALEDARLLNQESHIQSVKLVREAYNESENSFSEVVIYDTSKGAKEPEPAAPYIKQATPAPADSEDSDGVITLNEKVPTKKPPSPYMIAAMAIGVVATLSILWILLKAGKSVIQSVGSG